MANLGLAAAALAAQQTGTNRSKRYAAQVAALPGQVRGSTSAVAAAAGVLRAKPQVGAVRMMPQHLTAEIRDGSPWYRSYGPIVGDRPPDIVQSFAGIYDDGMDGILDVVKGIAQQVIPSHTVAGKLLAGNTSGAIQDVTKASVKAVAAAKQPAKPPPSSVEAVVTSLKPQNDTQKYMLIGAGVLALGLGFMVLRRR